MVVNIGCLKGNVLEQITQKSPCIQRADMHNDSISTDNFSDEDPTLPFAQASLLIAEGMELIPRPQDYPPAFLGSFFTFSIWSSALRSGSYRCIHYA